MTTSVAVDFTASNIEPQLSTSLHYVHPNGTTLNSYASAISSVGSVIEFYDHDQRYPLYGFGGKPQRGQPADHCFPLNGNEQNPEVHGVHGILDTYYQSLKTVQLSGPTLFGSIISQAAAIAGTYCFLSYLLHLSVIFELTSFFPCVFILMAHAFAVC